jgi:YD repeat-containing protein
MTFPTAVAMSYDGDGNITEVVEDGVTTAYTWNVDGTVATDTRNGVTRRYTWDVDGNLTGIVAT